MLIFFFDKTSHVVLRSIQARKLKMKTERSTSIPRYGADDDNVSICGAAH